jgi:hypothetical protein
VKRGEECGRRYYDNEKRECMRTFVVGVDEEKRGGEERRRRREEGRGY